LGLALDKLQSNWEDALSRHAWRSGQLWIQRAVDVAKLFWSERKSLLIRDRTVITFFAATIALHLLLIWFLLRSSRVEIASPQTAAGNLQVSIISTPSNAQLLKPVLQRPVIADVPEPQIVAAPKSDASAATGTPDTLAPRPDPQHENLPVKIAGAPVGLHAILRVLVGADGSVDEAEISTSSGQPDMDQAAIAFIKAHWKFLPATVGGNAVPFWTTVLVPLAGG
jgi:TonB family protein